MKTFYLNLFFLFIGSGIALAQDTAVQATVIGAVTDEQKKPLDYATVALFNQADSSLVKSAITDAYGKFQFLQIKPGNYYVKSSLMGYSTSKSDLFKIDAKNLHITLQDLRLNSGSKDLSEVKITSAKPLFERKTDKLVMNVENSSLMTGSNALEVLQKAPGVTVDQNDNISMQGKQGVMIQIDGKQTYMSNADVSNLLRSMQSSQIESIELITNPSAKYEASGNSGIINIKTRKSKNGGTNGSVSGTLGYGQNLNENASLNLNHRSEKVNLFGNYNFGGTKRNQDMTIDRISGQDGAAKTYFAQSSTDLRKNDSHNFKAGMDIFLNKNNTLGVLFSGYANTSDDLMDNNTWIGRSFSLLDSAVLAKNVIHSNYQNYAYNLNYKSVLDTSGQEITADLDYSRYHSGDDANYVNRFIYANGMELKPTSFLRNQSPSRINIKAVKIDYTLPLSKTLKLETGIKSSSVETDNNFIAEELKGSDWKNDPLRSNQFIYDENVNAAYFNLRKQFKSTSVQLGLRAEQTNSKGNSITENKITKRSYLDFFPSVFVNQTLTKDQTIGVSYSRRIDRPSYDALNPFIYYLDQYTYNQGNPFLNPQYTHNFEANYTLKRYSLSLNYSVVKDVITEVLLPNEEKKALFQTNANLAKNIVYGANLNVPISIFKWWQTNNNLNLFHLKFSTPDLAGKPLNTSKSSFVIKSQHTFIINPDLNAELSARYESPLEYGTLSIGERHGIDIGMSKSLMDKKINIKLALSDVFNTQVTRLGSTYPGLSYKLHQKNETRVARITFSYKFGKNELKPARKRATGVEEEKGRMKN
jgi:hypothetical protein